MLVTLLYVSVALYIICFLLYHCCILVTQTVAFQENETTKRYFETQQTQRHRDAQETLRHNEQQKTAREKEVTQQLRELNRVTENLAQNIKMQRREELEAARDSEYNYNRRRQLEYSFNPQPCKCWKCRNRR